MCISVVTWFSWCDFCFRRGPWRQEGIWAASFWRTRKTISCSLVCCSTFASHMTSNLEKIFKFMCCHPSTLSFFAVDSHGLNMSEFTFSSWLANLASLPCFFRSVEASPLMLFLYSFDPVFFICYSFFVCINYFHGCLLTPWTSFTPLIPFTSVLYSISYYVQT